MKVAATANDWSVNTLVVVAVTEYLMTLDMPKLKDPPPVKLSASPQPSKGIGYAPNLELGRREVVTRFKTSPKAKP